MYHVIKMDSTDLGITDSINYIRISEDGCFVPTDQEHAIVLLWTVFLIIWSATMRLRGLRRLLFLRLTAALF